MASCHRNSPHSAILSYLFELETLISSNVGPLDTLSLGTSLQNAPLPDISPPGTLVPKTLATFTLVEAKYTKENF